MTIDGEVSTSRYRIEPRDVVTLAGNLVDNAFDAAAGADGPRVEVNVTWDASHLSLRVGDNGPGIPEADHEHVSSTAGRPRPAEATGAVWGSPW